MVSFTHGQNIIYSQTQLDDIAHDPTLVYRSRVGLSANEKEEQFASNDSKSYLFYFIFFFFSLRTLKREML